MTEKIGEQVDLDEVSLDNARYAEADIQEALVDYLQRRDAKWHPDLVVPIGSPAGVFVAQYRERLFPKIPILYTGMDKRRLPPDALQKNAAFVGESFDAPGFIEDILQLAPATTNIAVVIGASPLEQYWTLAFKDEFARFTNRVAFSWLNDLSFDQMLDRVSKLPPRSFILLILLLRDASGVSHNADDALRRIHSVANAPVNSLFEHQLGLGIVGGRLYRAEQEGQESARIAIRILHGEPAASFPPRIVGPDRAQYDWRELRRWNISQERLPKGSVIEFRIPGVWDRHRNLILAAISVVLVQTILILGLVVNLTRRRRAERSLRDSEERMQLAASAADLGMWEWDFASSRVWISGRNAERLGLPNGDSSDYGQFLRTVHPEDRDGVAQAVAKAMSGDGEYEHVHRRFGSDGSVRWIAARGKVEFDREHKPLRMRGVGLDITARKLAEERARETERQFLLVANSAPVLIWMSGPDKHCIFFNETWLQFTGRTLAQELGGGWAQGVHSEDLPGCLQTYSEAFDARRPFTMEYRLRRHDGQYRWVSDHGVPRYDAQKNCLGYIGSCVDITDRKDAEAEARRSREELAHLTRVSTLGEMSGSLAHELNQPLAAILSNTKAALRFLDSGTASIGEVREILQDIVAEDLRAGEIIARMSSMLKRKQAKMQSEDLNQIIADALRLMRSELVIRNIRPVTLLAPNLALVRGDRVHLQQVLVNLIVNACDAMNSTPPSDRQITIETRSVDENFVQATVADRGTGFAFVDSKPVFEAFRTTKANGLGLGLPICRSLIELHGGKLWAGNESTGGAAVRFTVRTAREATT